jgi:hypothetical protein
MSDNVCMMYDVSQILKKAKLTLLRPQGYPNSLCLYTCQQDVLKCPIMIA